MLISEMDENLQWIMFRGFYLSQTQDQGTCLAEHVTQKLDVMSICTCMLVCLESLCNYTTKTLVGAGVGVGHHWGEFLSWSQ